MKRKVAILFAAKNALTMGHYRVDSYSRNRQGPFVGYTVWIRMQVLNTTRELNEVLATARPRKGETLLSAIEL